MIQHCKQSTRGFTIVEMMLAMGFLAIMLVMITLTVMQISNMYTRGITMRQVNQAGRTIVSDMQRTIASSSAFDAPESDASFINNPWGGRLCTGSYSYIWNTAQRIREGSISGSSPDLNTYTGSDSGRVIRLVRAVDAGGSYCRNPSASIDRSQSVELLDSGDRRLAFHSISIQSGAAARNTSTGQRLYTISFTLGTDNVQSINASIAGQERCRPPSEANADQDYCSVNRFVFTARAGVR